MIIKVRTKEKHDRSSVPSGTVGIAEILGKCRSRFRPSWIEHKVAETCPASSEIHDRIYDGFRGNVTKGWGYYLLNEL